MAGGESLSPAWEWMARGEEESSGRPCSRAFVREDDRTCNRVMVGLVVVAAKAFWCVSVAPTRWTRLVPQ